MKVSVVIPVYNQFESLMKVLHGFTQQDYSSTQIELIVIDDGSTDNLVSFNAREYSNKWGINLTLLHQCNQGRACARNTGIINAKGDIVVFCDGDRVPDRAFISEHVKMHESSDSLIVVGAAYDYFGKSDYIQDSIIDWDKVYRFSRLSSYYKKISMMYDSEGTAQSNIVWLSFLVGNSSVSRKVIYEEMFDKRFIDWGLEHFELAYRLYLKHIVFRYNAEAKNYHIPHKRVSGFYEKHIKESARLFTSIHPQINDNTLVDFIYSDMNINQAEESIFIRNEEK